MGVSDVSSLASKIAWAHATCAKFTGVPEVAIDAKEGMELAKSYQKLCEHYGVSALPKVWELWIGVLTTLGMVYGPRAAIVYARLNAERPKVQLDPGSELKKPQPPKKETAPPNAAVADFGGAATPSPFPQGPVVFG